VISPPPRLLIVSPHNSYRTARYIQAARQLCVDVLLLCGKSPWALPVDQPGLYFNPEHPEAVIQHLDDMDIIGVCATDDSTVELAAQIAARHRVRTNQLESVAFTRNKGLGRMRLKQTELNCPWFIVINGKAAQNDFLEDIIFPVVIKPTQLSASRGVIRANNYRELQDAIQRNIRLLDQEFKNTSYEMLIEEYIPGEEVAVEGLMYDGELHTLAIFDKPEPLTGPYFEESYYVTPSRHSVSVIKEILATTAKACFAYGIHNGPIHAEMRINSNGIWLLELACRTIGGDCGLLIEFVTGSSVEELAILNSLGYKPTTSNNSGAAGVLMIPVPATGILRRVEGIGAARKIPGIVSVEIDIKTGQLLQQWPEGGSYPGFIFSRGDNPTEVEKSLRLAHEELNFVVAPTLETTTN